MRILFQTAFRLIDTNQCQHFNGALTCLFFILVCVEQNCLHQLISNRKYRIQACHRILENDRALFPSELLHLLFVPLGDILAAIKYLSSGNFSGFRKNLHDRIRSNGFTGTGLSYNSQCLSRFQIKGDTIYRTNFPSIRSKAGMKIFYL